MGSSTAAKPRKASCSFSNLLLSSLNFVLFIMSAASFAPTILLKMPPANLGVAFLMVSCVSLLSAFVGFYSQLTQFCFVTHLALLIASLMGQVLGFVGLFAREEWSLRMLKSGRDPREAKVLVRMECGVLMAMGVMQVAVMALSCAVQSCWVREYEGLEADKEAGARKRSKRIARVQEESMANAQKIAEVKGKELDDKIMKSSKYGQWLKTHSAA